MYTSHFVFFRTKNLKTRKTIVSKSSKNRVFFHAFRLTIFWSSNAGVTNFGIQGKKFGGSNASRWLLWNPNDNLSGKRKNVYVSFVFFWNQKSENSKNDSCKIVEKSNFFHSFRLTIFWPSYARVTNFGIQGKKFGGSNASRWLLWNPNDNLSGKRKNVYVSFCFFSNQKFENSKNDSFKIVEKSSFFSCISSDYILIF